MRLLVLWSLFLYCCQLNPPSLLASDDPLSNVEVNQLRDAADDPPQKLRLYVKFINERVQSIEKVRSDRLSAQSRGQRIHDLIEDFTSLSDELDDNLDDADGRKADLRKVLPEIIDANAQWQKSLQSLQHSENDPNNAADARVYDFVLTNALQAVESNASSCADLLKKQQEELPKEKPEEGKKRAGPLRGSTMLNSTQ